MKSCIIIILHVYHHEVYVVHSRLESGIARIEGNAEYSIECNFHVDRGSLSTNPPRTPINMNTENQPRSS